jgi:uncharacterized membrane protein HdeD (DUF308 family)
MLANILGRYWWTTLARGVIWILFGIAVFAQPGISLVTLTLMFGAFALIDGIAGAVSAIAGRREHENWWVLLLVGLTGIAVGLMTFANPGMTALALLFYVAVWAIATGLLELVAAIRLRREIEGEFWLGLAGVVSIAFGAFVMARPAEGALSVLWLLASYAIAFGVILLALAFRVRGFMGRATAARAP